MVRYIADRLIEAETQQEKQSILERYSSDTLFQRILYYTYHPMIIFGLDDYEPRLPLGKEDGMGVSKFMHIPEDLAENKLDSDEARFACNLVFGHINEDEAEIFLGMLKKDIGVGLEIDTINNVWSGLIPNYPVQKPTVYTDDLAKGIVFPAVVQPYLKGQRINVIVKYNLVEFRDEHGNILGGFQEYVKQFSDLAQNQSIVFDTVLIKNYDETFDLNYSDDKLEVEYDKEHFVIVDVIRYDGFLKGLDNRILYNWRYNSIDHMTYLARDLNPSIEYSIIPSKVVNSWDDVNAAFGELSGDMVLKNLESVWMGGNNPGHLLLHKNPITVKTELSSNNTTVSTSATS
jgi:hypothetical protein